MEPKEKVVIGCVSRKRLVHIYEVNLVNNNKKKIVVWMIITAINLVIVKVGFVCNTYSLYGCWTTKNCDMDDQSELLI